MLSGSQWHVLTVVRYTATAEGEAPSETLPFPARALSLRDRRRIARRRLAGRRPKAGCSSRWLLPSAKTTGMTSSAAAAPGPAHCLKRRQPQSVVRECGIWASRRRCCQDEKQQWAVVALAPRTAPSRQREQRHVRLVPRQRAGEPVACSASQVVPQAEPRTGHGRPATRARARRRPTVSRKTRPIKRPVTVRHTGHTSPVSGLLIG
jgi:hypothetical protein